VIAELNGTNLFVATYGPVDAPALLFIHGHGGGYHFQQCQAELLAHDLRLIAPGPARTPRRMPTGGPDLTRAGVPTDG